MSVMRIPLTIVYAVGFSFPIGTCATVVFIVVVVAVAMMLAMSRVVKRPILVLVQLDPHAVKTRGFNFTGSIAPKHLAPATTLGD